MTPLDALHIARNNNHPVIFAPNDAGHEIEVLKEHMQPLVKGEITVGNDVQQHINEEVDIPPDIFILPDIVDHWVRRSACPKRVVNIYNSSINHKVLSDESETLTFKENARWAQEEMEAELALQEDNNFACN